MKKFKYIPLLLLAAALGGCSDEELGESIFPEVSDDADPSSYTYKFDTWLNRNFRDEYNLDFKYRMEDVEADMNYNLVPATLDNARDLAVLTKYLWFDSYGELCGSEFLKTYGPRIIHVIGSSAINPSSGTEKVGTAEGGLKVTLYKVNAMELDNIDQLNEYYFHTMHHEFGHILHQTKSYPTEFNLLSTGRYDDSSWSSKAIGYVASQGFITRYASSQAREDFAETIANYLTRPDSQLDLFMWMAKQGWSTGKESTTTSDDDDAVYYAYYYYPNPDDPDVKTYFLTASESDSSCRPCVIGESGEKFYTVEAVEAYLEKMTQRHTAIYPVEDKDNVNGADIITQKQNIVRNWFKDTWGLDFDKLREIVLRRQNDFNLNTLRAEIDNIQ